MKAEYTFRKALFLLDHGNYEKGEVALKDAIRLAKDDNDVVVLVQSLVCLGDLLHQCEREIEAKQILLEALALKNDEQDDLLDQEYKMADEILARINLES